ncbi:hypothetical protein D9M73_212050 [compost metagenome]
MRIGRVAGTGDTDFQRQEFIQRIDWPIAAKRHSTAGMGDAARGFHALESLDAKVITGAVDRGRCLLCPLERHGGRDVQCLEACVVGRVD